MQDKIPVPIVYCLVDDPSDIQRGLLFHLLNMSDVANLRCLMTLLMLPSDTKYLVTTDKPFTAALHRITVSPLILKVLSSKKPIDSYWNFLKQQPIVILLTASKIPVWTQELANFKPIGLLTPWEEIAKEAEKEDFLKPGLLKGFSDLQESYRVISDLIVIQASNNGVPLELRASISHLINRELFSERPRLSFIPPVPLPSPHNGRPAAYILNRLSNNVEKPSLMAGPDDVDDKGYMIVSRLLDYSRAACTALAAFENGISLPPETKVTISEIEELNKILSSTESDSEKLHHWMKLGDKITGKKMLSPLLISTPAARGDLLKCLPPTIKKESGYDENLRINIKAIKDHVEKKVSNFSNEKQQQAYNAAQHTLATGHRLMSVQSAFLGSISSAIPIQTSEIGYALFNKAKDLNFAFKHRTAKASTLFRQYEIDLARALPPMLLGQLIEGTSPVIFLSDLPFEWTLLEEFPICLTRPVSRIPVGGSDSWYVLTQSSRRNATINVDHPERVLVLDLIEEHDKIHRFSHFFREVSDSLGQRYTYKKVRTSTEIKELIRETQAEIVVLNTHGGYQKTFDELFIYLGDTPLAVREFLTNGQVPPVWILSACDMAVTGSVKGTMVAPLLENGAITVIGTLQSVDALAAAIFVGRLLTDIFSPPITRIYENLSEAYFAAQLTTALLYDPLLPLFRKSKAGTSFEKDLFTVVVEYGKEMGSEPMDVRAMPYKAAETLYKILSSKNLIAEQEKMVKAGRVMPETLLFTAFGLPTSVHLVNDDSHSDCESNL